MIKNNFKSYALIIIATIALTLISMLPIGILGILVTAFLVSVIGYNSTKHHYSFVALQCILVLLVYLLFSGNFIFALATSLPTILCGISLGISYNLKLTEIKTITITSAVYILYLLLNIKVSGIDFKELFISLINNYKDVFLSLYSDQISQAGIDKILAELSSVMIKFMPSFVIILSAITGLLMFYIFKNVLKYTKSDISLYKNFSIWHAEKSFSIAFFIILIVSSFLPKNNYFSDALANVAMVSEFVFYILGLSLASFILKLKIKNPSLRKVLFVLIVIFSFGTQLFIFYLLGALDGCFDFREKIAKNNLPN